MIIELDEAIQSLVMIHRLQKRMTDSNFTVEEHSFVTELWSKQADSLSVPDYCAYLKLQRFLEGESQ